METYFGDVLCHLDSATEIKKWHEGEFTIFEAYKIATDSHFLKKLKKEKDSWILEDIRAIKAEYYNNLSCSQC